MNKETAKRPELIAYTVTESGGENRYHRIGAAWQNSKGVTRSGCTPCPWTATSCCCRPKTRPDPSAATGVLR